ncbi:MAG: histidine phosphatase family protein [Fusobacteriaceae bacterium]
MGKLILIRHGETELNREKKFFGWLDPPLNDKGKIQALLAGKKMEKILLGRENIKIYISPLKRSVETYEEMNLERYPKEIIHDLKEINFGIFEGLSYEQILKKYPDESKKAFSKWEDYNFETGESPKDLQKRAISFIEKSIDKNKTNIIISHWGVINAILSYFFSKDLEAYWKFSLKNGGIALLDFNEGFPVLEGFNIGEWDE